MLRCVECGTPLRWSDGCPTHGSKGSPFARLYEKTDAGRHRHLKLLEQTAQAADNDVLSDAFFEVALTLANDDARYQDVLDRLKVCEDGLRRIAQDATEVLNRE